MTETDSQPIAENEQVKELLALLKDNNTPGYEEFSKLIEHVTGMEQRLLEATEELKAVRQEMQGLQNHCALPGFVDSKNEEKTERNAGYLVVSHSGGGMLRQGTRKGIRRTPANRGMRAHRIVKSLDISEDVCHGLCP